MPSDTRERVLKTLLSRHRCTINELAEEVGINPISIRHHIIRLEAEHLVSSEDERHGVGRPRRVYYLSDKGLEHFPTRYMQLAIRILQHLKGTVPPEIIDGLFTEMANDMASGHLNTLKQQSLSIEGRLDLLKSLLAKEGFTVDWEKVGDHYQIREINCPYYQVGKEHPEVCGVDQKLISTVLEMPTEKIQCILEGDAHCVYLVPQGLITPEISQ